MASHLSPEFIQKQKERLESEYIKTKKSIEMLREDDPFSDPGYADDNAAVDNDVREQTGHLTIESEIKQLESRLKDITIALQKIEKGTYGFDEKTNEPIPQSRLELVPEARFNVSTS
ncbi:MAG: hypothetical protein N2691_02505 [Patescibacteria group bacterium]|nr:hypothetical protein [Patescibacteria group bacterium]